MLPGEPCPARPEYSMNLDAGMHRARLPANPRARLDAVDAVGKEAADEQPPAPFPRGRSRRRQLQLRGTVNRQWTWMRRI